MGTDAPKRKGDTCHQPFSNMSSIFGGSTFPQNRKKSKANVLWNEMVLAAIRNKKDNCLSVTLHKFLKFLADWISPYETV